MPKVNRTHASKVGKSISEEAAVDVDHRHEEINHREKLSAHPHGYKTPAIEITSAS
jgi:hypothetical protein